MTNASYLILPRPAGVAEYIWVGPAAPVPGTDIPAGDYAYALTPTGGDMNPNHYLVTETRPGGVLTYTVTYRPPALPSNVAAFLSAAQLTTEQAALAPNYGVVLP